MTIFEDLGNHLTSTLAGAFAICEDSSAYSLPFTYQGANLAASARPGEFQPFIIKWL